MNRLKLSPAAVARVAAATTAALALVPAPALAEGPSGPDLLVPKPAEFVPALIAFLVIWFVLAKFAWPQILGMMEAREAKIRGDLDEAAATREAAEQERAEVAEKLVAARRKADDIVAQARRDAEQERSRILAKAQADASATIAKAHDALASERRRAEIELSDSVIDLSVEIAAKIIGNDLGADEQRRLAERYLAEVGGPDDKQA